MSTAKKLPDAALYSLYRWIQHGDELVVLTPGAAIKQTADNTPEKLQKPLGFYDR